MSTGTQYYPRRVMKKIDIHSYIENESIQAFLFIIFALFFTIPFLFFLFIVNKYDLLLRGDVLVFIALSLFFPLIGLVLFRYFVNAIIAFSTTAESLININPDSPAHEKNMKLKNLSDSFHKLINELNLSTSNLDKRIFELSVLHELGDISSSISDLG